VCRDYGDKVNFYYVYKSVEHPGINGFVEPFSIEERLKHVASAKERINTQIPWLCDSMENEVKEFFGMVPNGEFVIDPEGKIVRQRFWSDADALRADLEELVGKSDTFTKVADVETGFKVETIESEDIASGVVAEIELPKGLAALQVIPDDSDMPYYAKLRVEGTAGVPKGSGQLHFLLTLDPLYKYHWNNLAGKVRIELSRTDGMKFSSESMESDPVEAKADIDPRRFLVDFKSKPSIGSSSFIATVTYFVCDDAGTICVEVEQEYRIVLDIDRDGGTRPGIFMIEMFEEIPEWDKNEDGVITMDELPSTPGSLIMSHLDYSGDGVADKDEVAKFVKMFNNGKMLGRPDGVEEKPESSDEAESSETEAAEGEGEEAAGS